MRGSGIHYHVLRTRAELEFQKQGSQRGPEEHAGGYASPELSIVHNQNTTHGDSVGCKLDEEH